MHGQQLPHCRVGEGVQRDDRLAKTICIAVTSDAVHSSSGRIRQAEVGSDTSEIT